MSGYLQGHIKRNAETGDVAIRTIFPEDQGEQMANMAWLVATSASGARTTPTSAVESWEDVFTPPAPAPAPMDIPPDPS